MQYIAQVAVGWRSYLNNLGNDYDTSDGTGERDYIHVVDLARAHVAAIACTTDNAGCEVFNVGTGSAFSVMEMVKAFEAASSTRISVEIVSRREVDLASYFANTSKANKRFG